MALIFGLGLVAIGFAVFRRTLSGRVRVLTGMLGGLLVMVGFAHAAITLLSLSSETRVVVLNLDSKRIVEDSCGDTGETCARYVLESTTGTTAYEFDVSVDVYNKAQVNACYNISYYPQKGLFASDASAYQQIDQIALIKTTDHASCR
jgi:hypothetical protein